MKINDIYFTLKDGRKAVLRNPEEKDIPGMIDYLRISAGETDFILRVPEECDKYTPEAEKELFDRVNAADNQLMLVCEIDGEIAGNCEIVWNDKVKLRHRGEVAIALLKKYWNLGIGTKMFEVLMETARNNPNLIQLELDFVEGNSRARALYEKMGFRITGVRPNAIRLMDGTLLNEYSMIKEIKR